jgi:hypothetical protein
LCPVAAEPFNDDQIQEVLKEMKMECSQTNRDGPKILALFRKVALNFRVRE